MRRVLHLTARQRGFTLVEVTVVILIAAIPMLAVGVLLSGASRAWQHIYDDSRSPARLDAYAVMASLQTFGRQANLAGYTVYRVSGNSFVKAVPPSGQDTAIGQAVEFWYWKEPFNPAEPDTQILDINNAGTHYALYYLDGSNLKVDFGQVVNGVGGVRNNARHTAALLETQRLSENVDISKNINIFNHTMLGGQGNGCVNTDLTLTDDQGVTVEVKFTTLIRSAWPR
jgi:prepilin-type N-terminal cleavage/methylation domain-containing protein